jgi:S-DNA-T family DNA segregation ATPase FtsK/SpoIIIE
MWMVVTAGGREREVEVGWEDAGARVADLVAALGLEVPPSGRVRLGGAAVDGARPLDDCGLVEGVVLDLDEDPEPWPEATEPEVLEVQVVGGPDAGRRVRLAAGRHRLDGVALLDVRAGGQVSVSYLASTASTVTAGSEVELGAVRYRLVPLPAVELDRVAVAPPRTTGHTRRSIFDRPPRPVPAEPPPALVGPDDPPRVADPPPAGAATVLVPVLSAAMMVAVTGDLRYGAFAIVGPLMAIVGGLERRRQVRRQRRAAATAHAEAVAELEARLAERTAGERSRREEEQPDLCEVVHRAAVPSRRLWERRPGDDDVLCLRLGRCDQPWAPPVHHAGRSAQVAAAISRASSLAGAPAWVPLDGAVVGIAGDLAVARAVARSLVCQAAVHHGPADLAIAVCTGVADGPAADEWAWMRWLPHGEPSAGSPVVGADPDSSAGVLAAVLDRRAAGAGPPLSLVVLDGDPLASAESPALRLVRGARRGLAVVVLAADAASLPAACTDVLLVGPSGAGTLHRRASATPPIDVLVDGASEATARACARSLARFEDPEQWASEALPRSVSLLDLLDLGGEPTAEGVLTRWEGGCDRWTTPIGVGTGGPVAVDLVADGPHLLVAGTTGAGKSELLRSLVAGLAAGTEPDALVFVLVDFKGGSAFDELAGLPHVVGLVTDLDHSRAQRALRSLDAELRHREHTLRAAGTADLDSYLGAGAPGGPLPRLVVIVDELATLKAELPGFVDALVGVAQRGRSLGVHLVLATQRPRGALSENIRANTDLRIALRVQDPAESTDVIGGPDAAALDRATPGRALLRAGASAMVAFQTATTATVDARTDGETALITVGASPSRTVPATESADARRNRLPSLVAAIAAAFERSGRPRPRRPFLPPLPSVIHLEPLLRRGEGGDMGGLPARVPFAVADDPDRQRQAPWAWRPAEGGLLVLGLVGSGTTTALSSLALAIATTTDPARCHLQVVDLGGGTLGPLAGLPHCGAVVGAAEPERVLRLLRVVRRQLDRRLAAPPAARRDDADLVVLVDGFAALVTLCDEAAATGALDGFAQVVARGPEVGIHVVLAGDRPGSVPAPMAALLRQRLLLGAAADLPGAPVVRGRGVAPADGLAVHVAVPSRPVSETVAAIAAASRSVAADRAPDPVEVLPERIDLVAIDRGARNRVAARPWRLAVGRRESDLAAAVLTIHAGEHVLVSGPARSGRSSALATIGAAARAGDRPAAVIAVAGRRSALAGADGLAVHPRDQLGSALDMVAAATGPTVLLVDDADEVDDPDGRLEALVTNRDGRGDDLLVAAAGRADALAGLYAHWTRALRRHRLGVLLRPRAAVDGDLLGVALPLRSPVATVPGRGYLVEAGTAELVQLALPPPPRAVAMVRTG